MRGPITEVVNSAWPQCGDGCAREQSRGRPSGAAEDLLTLGLELGRGQDALV